MEFVIQSHPPRPAECFMAIKRTEDFTKPVYTGQVPQQVIFIDRRDLSDSRSAGLRGSPSVSLPMGTFGGNISRQIARTQIPHLADRPPALRRIPTQPEINVIAPPNERYRLPESIVPIYSDPPMSIEQGPWFGSTNPLMLDPPQRVFDGEAFQAADPLFKLLDRNSAFSLEQQRKQREQLQAISASRNPAIVGSPALAQPVNTINPVITGSGGGEVATDWGSLIGGLGEAYINTRWAQPGPQLQPVLAPAVIGGLAAGAGALGDWLGDPSPGFGLPGIDIVGTGDSTKGKLYNPRTGKWQRSCRRRRKLLTDGDFRCLASLKTLTGNGAAFTAAVVRAVR